MARSDIMVLIKIDENSVIRDIMNKRVYSYTEFKSVALFCHLVKFGNESNVLYRCSKSIVSETANCY